jgi:hypothetical protein
MFLYSFILICALPAQTERFIQRLTWEQVAFASAYEILVERQAQDGASVEEVLRKKTEELSLDCSLSAGSYRSRVTGYNHFGRPEALSVWAMFEIISLPAKDGYTQHLSWEAHELASRYEVEIQQSSEVLGAAEYHEILRMVTESSFIDCTLPEGNYRYRIILYNLFGRPEASSDWAMFEIKAPEPEPEVAIEPESAPASESQSLPLPAMVVEPKPEPPTPQEPQVPVAPTPPFILQAAYTPLVPVPGSFLNSFYDTRFFLIGAEAHIAFLPLRGKYSAFGFELAPVWTYITSEADTYTIETHFMSGHFNLLYQQWLPGKKVAFMFRLGGGVSMLYDFSIQYENDNEPEKSLIYFLSAGAGLSFQWFIIKPLFIEIGADYLYLFSEDKPSPMYIRPFVGLGVQF